MTLDLMSENYPPSGGISGSGIERILGTPTHDPLEVVVRESVQNTWDAREAGARDLAYRISIRTLSSEQFAFLREKVLRQVPHGDTLDPEPLTASLAKDRMQVIVISDFGTSGLGGPVRANLAGTGKEATDFIDFIRNIGSARDTAMGGGTYGFGKSSLYRLSRCNTICVHSLGKESGAASERFIACRIGGAFEHDGRRHTGRHWWGSDPGDGIVDPVLGDGAASIASGLGLPSRHDQLFGTSIVILDPELEEMGQEEAAQACVDTLLWNFWPKLIPDNPPSMKINFSVDCEGKDLPVPEPSDWAPLQHFVSAYRKLRDGRNASDWEEIWCLKPKTLLGRLAVAPGPVTSRPALVRERVPKPSRHIALMRPAELVIRYLDCHPMPSQEWEYGGVFICDDEVESIFAKAEPPAHDDWVPDYLSKSDARLVRVALRRIADVIRSKFGGIESTVQDGGERQSAGRVGDALGALLPGQRGSRLGGFGGRRPPQRTASSSGGGARGVSIGRPSHCGFMTISGQPCALFHLSVRNGTDSSVTLVGHAAIKLEGGQSDDDYVGDDAPQVLRWIQMGTAEVLSNDSELILDDGRELEILAAVRLAQSCAVNFFAALKDE